MTRGAIFGLKAKNAMRSSHLSGLALAWMLAPAAALAQAVTEAELQKRANAILTLMGFAVTPDVTTGSLSLTDQTAGNPYFRQTSLSGGGTLPGRRLYLEGTLAYGRYDPDFATNDDSPASRVAVEWNSLLGTGGVGWDFPLAPHLVLRPIFNFSLGRIESSAALPATRSLPALEFLSDGRLNAYGLGGSLMLDYERYRPGNEIDVELRYSSIQLHSFDSSRAVEGQADAQTLSLWSRYRAPTGMTALERPVRYVFEYAYTRFLGDLDGTLGFTYVNSFGGGLELDSSARDVYVTRSRLMVRYKVGNNVTGWALGLGVSF
jgi:hypothetical protein